MVEFHNVITSIKVKSAMTTFSTMDFIFHKHQTRNLEVMVKVVSQEFHTQRLLLRQQLVSSKKSNHLRRSFVLYCSNLRDKLKKERTCHEPTELQDALKIESGKTSDLPAHDIP